MAKFIRSGKLKYSEGYKYQIREEFTIDLSGYLDVSFSNKFFSCTRGLLWIKEGYAWDGASGPTIDTNTSMVGSCVHDVLYQAMRKKILDIKYRQKADEILRDICKEDGMYSWRADIWYYSVRKFAGASADSKNEKKIYEAP